MSKKLCLLLTCIVCAVTLTGCNPEHSKRELNSIAIVMGLGLDLAQPENDIPFEEGRLHVTAQVVRTGSLTNGNSGNGGPSNSADAMYWNLTMEGDDLYPMLRGSVQQSNRNLYISHNQVIVFGQDLAIDGVAPFMDYFFREREMRYNVLLAVSECPAGQLLECQPSLENLPAQEIAKLLKIQARNAEAPTESLFDFAVDMKTGKKAAVLPLLNAQKEEDKETIYVDGCAVFQDWKMIGKLNAAETRGYLWTSGDIESTVFTVPVDDTRISLGVTGKQGDMKVILRENAGEISLQVQFEVSADAVIGHMDGVYDFHQKDSLSKIQRACSKLIANEIQQAVQKSKELNSDLFGVSEYLERYHPSVWKKMEDNWNQYFTGITYEIGVTSHVRRTGSLVDPVLDEGAGL